MKRKDGYVEEIERDLATLRRENRNFQKAYEAAEKEVLQDRPEDDREFTPLEKPVVIPKTYLEGFQQYGKVFKMNPPEDGNEFRTVITPEDEERAKDWDPQGPQLISFEQFTAYDGSWDQITLTYYEEDDTLCDEDDLPVDNVEYLIGPHALDHFGEFSKNKDTVYVVNPRISALFEVVRSGISYAEMLGFPQEEPKVPKMKMRDHDD